MDVVEFFSQGCHRRSAEGGDEGHRQQQRLGHSVEPAVTGRHGHLRASMCDFASNPSLRSRVCVRCATHHLDTFAVKLVSRERLQWIPEINFGPTISLGSNWTICEFLS